LNSIRLEEEGGFKEKQTKLLAIATRVQTIIFKGDCSSRQREREKERKGGFCCLELVKGDRNDLKA
jgi:hypothetical protein